MGREGYVCLVMGSDGSQYRCAWKRAASDGSQYRCAWKRAASTSCTLFLLHLPLYRRQDNRELKIDTNKM